MRFYLAPRLRTLLLALPALVWACQAPAVDQSAEVESRSIEIVRAYTTAIGSVDYPVLQASIKDSAVWHYRGRTYDWTAESERDTQEAWKRAFPDQEYRIEMIFAKRDTVVSLMTYTGTHSDTILGIPPTGRTVAVPEVAIYRLEGELLAESWVVFDEYLLRRQLTR